MKKLKLFAIALFVLLMASVAVLSVVVQKQRATVQRLSSNQDALLSDVFFYKSESDKNAASIKALELTRRELEEDCKELTSQVKDLGIKLRRAEQVAQAGIKTEAEIKTIVRDSIIYRDRIDTVKCFSWEDPWLTVMGIMHKDSLYYNISIRDTLTTVLHRKRQCIFRKPDYYVDIVSSNPYTVLEYERFIKVVK